MGIYLNTTNTSATYSAGYDNSLQNEFLQAADAYKEALQAASANPTNPALTQKLEDAARVLYQVISMISSNGTDSDQALVKAFYADSEIHGEIRNMLADAGNGDLNAVFMDLTRMRNTPGDLDHILEGIVSFQQTYPSEFAYNTRNEFLSAEAVFEYALKAAEADPNDPAAAQRLFEAGRALAIIQQTLKQGDAADKALAESFDHDTQGLLLHILFDCTNGLVSNIQTDVLLLLGEPDMNNTILNGLKQFREQNPING
jgi:hypothetical protein